MYLETIRDLQLHATALMVTFQVHKIAGIYLLPTKICINYIEVLNSERTEIRLEPPRHTTPNTCSIHQSKTS
jgi:hypothetical protein